ncbi:cupin domain-containing protein [Planotetraspora silvatica]|uniref:cupin domain-containing protein n=1 Tax=Planotetraspora silvatica TaxID=234614 RepID=UPI001EF37DBF|nr:cupin domain-containing protein [Planotetraspora silvatica]
MREVRARRQDEARAARAEPCRTIGGVLVMTLAAYPDGPSASASDDADALRVAAEEFDGPEPVIAVGDDGRVRFLRRDVTGAFVAVQERPVVAEALGLLPHPEGGWFRETWRTSASFEPPGYGGARQSATGIYFLLHPGEESVWHVVRSDEVWFWHRGGPLTLVLGGAGDRPGDERTVTLGPDVEHGQVPQALVPAGTWQAARPAGAEGVLVSCVVSPGFDFADFRAV